MVMANPAPTSALPGPFRASLVGSSFALTDLATCKHFCLHVNNSVYCKQNCLQRFQSMLRR